MVAGQLALTVAAVFTGAAIYINIAEQPARLQLDDRSLLAKWLAARSRGPARELALYDLCDHADQRRLMNTPAEAATAETRRMRAPWGAFHAGRSALGLAATLAFLWAQR